MPREVSLTLNTTLLLETTAKSEESQKVEAKNTDEMTQIENTVREQNIITINFQTKDYT